MAKVNALLSSWTSTRAGYIDTINTNANNAKNSANEAKSYAANAQNYTATNNTGNKTGILSQKLTYLINLLENTTYGLNAIKNQTNNLKSSVIKSIQTGIINTYTDDYTYTVTISPVNINKTIVLVQARNKTYNTSDECVNPVGHLKSSTELELFCTRYSYDRCYYEDIFYQIVEFY